MPLRPMEDMAAKVALVFIAMTLVVVPTLMFSKGWVEKQTMLYTIEADLLKVRMGPGIGAKALQALGSAIGPKTGDFMKDKFGSSSEMDLQEFQDYVCAFPAIPGLTLNMCGIWQNVLIASWVMLFGCGFGLLVIFCGGILLCQYAFVKASGKMRVWSMLLLVVGPFFLVASEVQYIIIATHVADMPPSMDGSTVGPNAIIGASFALISFVPAFIIAFLIGKTSEEQRVDLKKEFKRFQAEQEVLGDMYNQPNYGTYGEDNYSMQPEQPQSYGAEAAGYGYGPGPEAGGYGYGGAMLQGTGPTLIAGPAATPAASFGPPSEFGIAPPQQGFGVGAPAPQPFGAPAPGPMPGSSYTGQPGW